MKSNLCYLELRAIPLVYDLSFRSVGGLPAFVLTIHDEVVAFAVTGKSLIGVYQGDWSGLGDWVSGEANCGFGGCFERLDKPEIDLQGFSSWRAVFDPEDHLAVYRLGITLSVILMGASIFEIGPNAKGFEQIAHTEVSADRKEMRFPISVTFSLLARSWIFAHPREVEQKALEALTACYSCFNPGYIREYAMYQLEAVVSEHSLRLVVPGNCACLGGLSSGCRQQLSSHNIDGFRQQLSLLAGVCQIIQLIRESN